MADFVMTRAQRRFELAREVDELLDLCDATYEAVTETPRWRLLRRARLRRQWWDAVIRLQCAEQARISMGL